ncbi:ATP-binding protein [Salinactinospora qingdaonensis]|uniref:Histidine kinase/HSP90-like ATPase domain-containing protein n=1 Tax=Salinactinospora qingdaonensis TaxID=702744 RepID=A0ABP7FGF2_9ACTN
MPSLSTVAPLPEVTVPLSRFVPPPYRHYFSGRPECPNYKRRRFDFCGEAAMMPLVRAFLDTCAADQGREYRYLFTLLGSELATNALRHTRSGTPDGVYTLLAERFPTGLRLTCRDDGDLGTDRFRVTAERRHLSPDPAGYDPQSESGRGLLLVDALSTAWGDNGWSNHRHVWFYLAYDLEHSAWPTT